MPRLFVSKETPYEPPMERSEASTGMNWSARTRYWKIWYALLMRILSLAHSTYQHQYHLVWGTKYRKKFLKDYVKADLLESFYTTVEKYPTLHIETVNVDQDHVHLQIEIPPNIAVSKVVQVLKQNASRNLKKKYTFIRRLYLENSIWSVGYFSSTIGLNEEVIRLYIENQGKEEYPKQSRLE